VSLVSVIFSFRNEEPVLGELVRRTRAVFSETAFDYELIFINDASTDRSCEILLAERKKDPRIRILNMARRFGVFNCFMAGFDHASGDAVVMMDADLQDPPEVIPKLIAIWQEGAGVVHTARTKRKGESWLKAAVTKLGYRIWKGLIPIDLILDSGDFRLLSKAAVRELVKFREPDPFFRCLTRRLGFRQEVVSYERDKRFAGKTHFPLFGSWGPIKTFLAAIFSFSASPVKAAVFLAVVTGFAVTGLAAWNLFGHGINVVGARHASPLLMMFTGATLLNQMVVLLILSVYAHQVFQASLNRPLYVVESQYGF
jgi:polyisoprenyl-phosphate glycosyltransferase